jgi:hypothetical protein
LFQGIHRHSLAPLEEKSPAFSFCDGNPWCFLARTSPASTAFGEAGQLSFQLLSGDHFVAACRGNGT